MEHEDNTHLDNYLQSQNLLGNLQIASGGGVGGGGGNIALCGDVGNLNAGEEIVAGIGSNIGGKFDEHDERDDEDEWKYINEVQQSEKQQTMKVDGKAVEASVNDGVGNGVVDGDCLLDILGQHKNGNGNVNVVLNPDAKEFVPSSNPASPTSPTAKTYLNVFDGAENENVGEPVSDIAGQQQLHPSAIPRHLLGDGMDDDFVAQSPRKGRGTDMDEIPLPLENEFEHEAAQRPHELEREGDLISDDVINQSDSPLEQFENGMAAHNLMEHKSTPLDGSLIDHGPETSVDLDAESDMQQDDIMKRSIYVENNAPIEDILNTVQPLPSDSEMLNESFSDNWQQENNETATFNVDVGGKELFYVEDNDNVSHSPSTEEMQMNLRNDLNTSARDIPQIDIDDIGRMQNSFYMEHTSSEAQNDIKSEHSDGLADESLVINTSMPLNDSLCDVAHSDDVDNVSVAAAAAAKNAPPNDLLISSDFGHEQKEAIVDTTPSPLSTVEEKHLMEETKEHFDIHGADDDDDDELQENMNEILHNDGNLPQVEEVANKAITITQNESSFFTQDSNESHQQHDFDEPPPHELQHQFEQNENDFRYEDDNNEFGDILAKNLDDTALPISRPESAATSEPQSIDALAGDLTPQPQSIILAQPETHAVAPEPESILLAQTEQHNATPEPQPRVDASENELLFEAQQQAEHIAAFEQQSMDLMAGAFTEPRITTPEPQHSVAAPESDSFAVAHEESELIATLEPESIVVPAARSPTPTPTPEPIVAVEPPVSEPEADISQRIAVVEPIVKETAPETLLEKVSSATAAVGAAVVAGAAAAVAGIKKSSDAIKKPAKPTATTTAAGKSTSSVKPKVADTKKSTVEAKKTTTTTAAAVATARPRTAPVRSTLTAEKKTTTAAKPASGTTTTTSATARRPLTASSARSAPKTGTTTTTTTSKLTTATKASTLRTTAASPRRSAPTAAASAATTTNGTTAAKTSRPSLGGAAPSKPTTLGLTTTAKPRVSPRSTLTSQLRKTTPASSASRSPTAAAKSPTVAARSPTKSTMPTTNGMANRAAATGGATRARPTTGSATGTKLFTARPAPKTTNTSSVTTTTRRIGVTGTASSHTSTTTTTTTSKTSNAALRKSPLTKPTTLGTGKMSPTKSVGLTATLTKTTKTKEVIKKTPLKPKQEAEAKLNGGGGGAGAGGVVGENEKEVQLKINGDEKPPQANGNGDAHVVLQNGNGDENHDLLAEPQRASIVAGDGGVAATSMFGF